MTFLLDQDSRAAGYARNVSVSILTNAVYSSYDARKPNQIET